MENKINIWKIVSFIFLCILVLRDTSRLKAEDERFYEKELELKKEWGDIVAEDYFQLLEQQSQIEEAVMRKLQNIYDLGTITKPNEPICMPQLEKVCAWPSSDGTAKALYIIYHFSDRNPHAYSYSGILVDYTNSSSKLLFRTDAEPESYFTSLMGLYDVKIVDVDGNGEEDIILLAERYSTTTYGDIAGVYFLIGLQQNGEFQLMTKKSEIGLREIVSALHEEPNANRKIDNILDKLKMYWGYKTDAMDADKKELEDYIEAKEKKIKKKVDIRSEYIAEELLGEFLYVDNDKGLECIKVYKERAGSSQCNADKQIALYIFNYRQEEEEKQEVPDIYAELSEKCGEDGRLEDIDLVELKYEDQNGDGTKDVQMLVECVLEQGEKIRERYKITFFQTISPMNPMKKFNDITVEKMSTGRYGL